jgi:hypothetical protein
MPKNQHVTYTADVETREMRIPFDSFPEVHNGSQSGVHVHVRQPGDVDAKIAAVDGDTPRNLLALGLVYIGMADAMHRGLGMGMDDTYTTPKTKAQNGRLN